MKLRLLFILVAIFAVGALGAGAAAAAPPEGGPAQAVCEASGHSFIPTEVGYFCAGVPGNALSDADFRAGTALCEHVYGGTFIYPSELSIAYFCAVGLG